jgi:DNA polymerase V
VGRGTASKLERLGIYTMGDIARCSLENEDLLYKLFGINAELLIDHAWGYEDCKMSDIKAYKPSTHSLCSGQVLHCPYSTDGARLIVREMCDLLVLDMVEKGVATSQLTLTVGYEAVSEGYGGEVSTDYYGRRVPKSAHGSINFKPHTSSTEEIVGAAVALFDRIINPTLQVRRVNISANNLISESERKQSVASEQLDLFTDYAAREEKEKADDERYKREKSRQNAMISIRKKFGGNAILKGMNLEDGATTIDRNKQIGGHKA